MGDLGAACNDYKYLVDLQIDQLNKLKITGKTIPPTYNDFLKTLRTSKYSLDLNGVGDPNKRTFEILSSGSLLISQYNDLKWPFDELFSQETIFKNDIEFIDNITKLNNDNTLYTKCLLNQIHIYNKYFNKKWIKEYIVIFI